MKNVFLNTFSILIFVSIQIFPQQFSAGSPEWLIDMFFNKDSFPDKADYFSGEMLNEINEPTIGEELNGKGKISFRQIKADNDKIVFAIEIKKDTDIIDFYGYLLKQGNTWKLDAIRRFLLPSFIYTVRDSLSHLNTFSKNDSTFLFSLQLFTASDDELTNYLKTNLENFQKLVSSFNNNLKEQVDKTLASVGCNAIYSDRKYPGCVFIQILKFDKMECGFIKAANSVLLPKISVKRFICIEEVVLGWFIYRIM